MVEELKIKNGTILSLADNSEKELKLDKVSVHTMPKRYLAFSSTAKQAKGIGMLVLIFGIIILIVGSIFLYFYVFSPGEKTVKISPPPISTAPNNTAAPASAIKQNNLNNKGKEIKKEPIKAASSSLAEENNIITNFNSNINTASSATSAPADNASNTAIKKIEAASSSPVKLIAATDSDGDGLSDLEESLLGSNPRDKDSDGDGYSDLSEVLNLYNPTGSGSIISNSNIKKYTNNSYNYILYYPGIWKINEVGGQDSIVFNIGNNQFVQIITQENKDNLSLDDWYKKELSVDFIPSSLNFYKKGWQGLTSADGFTVYLNKTKGDKIIIMTYNLGTSNILSYKNIFTMMVNSLKAL